MKVTEVFFKNLKAYRDGYTTIINKGGTGCFAADQTVITRDGPKKISELTDNDFVLSLNEDSKEDEFRAVKRKFIFKDNDKHSIRIRLKSGEVIEATEDHKFLYKGRWVSLKHIVSLFNARTMEADPGI